MEKCSRKVNSHSVARSVYLMGLFDWKLVKEEKHDNAPSVLFFERNENVPYYQEMVAIEKETSPKLIPFWLLVLPVALAFICMTTLLILYLLRDEGFDVIKYFYAFFLPSMALLLTSTILFFFRSKQFMKYLKDEQTIVKNAEDKMSELRKKYASKEEAEVVE